MFTLDNYNIYVIMCWLLYLIWTKTEAEEKTDMTDKYAA